jgi:tetratricopeptide (TPR) repeat protein
MQHGASPRRLALLAAALLSACAAGEGSAGVGERGLRLGGTPSTSGAFGAYLSGRFAASEADTATAADRLLAALRADPDQPKLLEEAFRASLLDGRSDALRLARRLPDDPVANLLLAGADAQAGRWDRAEQRVRGVSRSGPVQLIQPVLLAWLQVGRGQPDQALAALRPAVEGQRLRVLNALHAAMIADVAGRPREAERFARIAVADQPQLPPRAAILAAGLLHRSGHPAEAQRLLETLAASGDDSALVASGPSRRAQVVSRGVSSPTDGMAEAYVSLAGSLRGQGSGELVLVLAQLALRLRPGFAPASMLTADVLADEKQEEQALAVLARVSSDDPLAPLAAVRRAAVLDKLDRPDDAVAVLRRLSESNPGMPQPAAHLGDLLRRRNRFAEAATAYDQALARVSSRSGGVRDWPLFYSRAIARERAGDWPRAEADLLRALELSPDQPYVLNYLGYTWADQGRNLDRAKAMLLRATELRPQDGNIADSLGWVLYRVGDLRGAVTWLEKAVELEPRSSVINDHLGDAYWGAGRQREARFQWRRALNLDPEPEEGPKIEAKLRDGLPSPPSNSAQR